MDYLRWYTQATSRTSLYSLGLFAVLALLFAWHAGTPVLHVWDEARLAINAIEMLRSGDWLVTRYDGQPDLWNTKPPLLIWLQASSLHWLGYNTWAVRLPSVLAALTTSWLLYRFGRYTLGSSFVGTFAAFILATSPGFNGTHVARFGDYDALLTLGLTATTLNWYSYAQLRHTRQLWVGALWFAIALLTKSAAAVLLLPAVAVAGLLPDGRWVFKRWHTYAAVAGAFGPLALFYGLREAVAPGYLAAVWFNDWYGRFSQHIVTVEYPRWIYLQRLLFPGMLTWSWLLPIGGWLGFRTAAPPTPTYRFAQFASLYIIIFLAFLSLARTRLLWYSAPVYPMASLLCALSLAHLGSLALHNWQWPRATVASLLALALVVPAGLLLRHEDTRWEVEKADPALHYGYQLPPLMNLQPKPTKVNVASDGHYEAVLLFYCAALRQAGILPTITTSADCPN